MIHALQMLRTRRDCDRACTIHQIEWQGACASALNAYEAAPWRFLGAAASMGLLAGRFNATAAVPSILARIVGAGPWQRLATELGGLMR